MFKDAEYTKHSVSSNKRNRNEKMLRVECDRDRLMRDERKKKRELVTQIQCKIEENG